MSYNAVTKQLGGAEATGEGCKGKAAGEQLQEYERPETVRVGPVGEVTQGNHTNRLDGDYGPGWTLYR